MTNEQCVRIIEAWDPHTAATILSRYLTSWQPIETAPKDGTEILVLSGGNKYLVSWTETMIQKGWAEAYFPGEDFSWHMPTHWLPIPPNPVSI